jgi:hypothetical protein
MTATIQSKQHLTPADDGLHPPPNRDDPMWTESYYFGFDLEERALSLAVYPLFRQNLGIWSLAIHLWDHTTFIPWEIPYSKFLWHLPLPSTADLTDFHMAGLRYKTLEPLQRYLVAYDDPGRLSMQLEFDGIDKPYASWAQVDKHSQVAGKGHFDQDCRVTGHLVLNGEHIRIDTFGHRDRSWYSRPDSGPRRSVSISFGINAAEQFLVMRPQMVGTDADPNEGVDGYLVRDGIRSNIRSATRRVTERIETRAQGFELEAVDELGRRIEATGRANNAFAFNTSPPIFAWFSQVSWDTPAGRMIGEDQETYSYGDIGPILKRSRLR